MADRVPVAAHPWVYASRREGYDILPIVEEIIADMACAGLDGIELMHTALTQEGAVERIAAASEKEGLPVIGSSFGGNMWEAEQAEAVVQEAYVVTSRLQALGGKTLGVSVGKAPGPKTPEQFDVQAKVLREIDAMCTSAGIAMNLHNHTYEVENGEHDLRGTLSRFPEAKLGPDLNWLLRAGVDPVDFIRSYGRRIIFLHLRDQAADGRWVEGIGDGDTDFAAIAGALREVRFEGIAAIELAWEGDFKPTRPLRETLKLSREHLRNTMGW
ncbi:MAG: sugar phosphate isomerase/epimerase [Armatimonadetes bacterium]|nr:sugar phosphate isomerase/epimerase [Armatimonadota bacterium]